jgi:retron-type reverse transcriptase
LWTSTGQKFFDRVNHDRLMAKAAERIADKRVLRLIRALLFGGRARWRGLRGKP